MWDIRAKLAPPEGLTLKCSNFPLILSFFPFSAEAQGRKEGRIKRRRENREIKARLFLFPASASLAFVRNESKDRKKKERVFSFLSFSSFSSGANPRRRVGKEASSPGLIVN